MDGWRGGCLSPCLALLFLFFFLTTVGVVVAWAILTDGFSTVDVRRSTTRWRQGQEETILLDLPPSDVGMCTSKACVIVASEMLKNRNVEAPPCEDFYAHACGNYKDHRSLSEDRRRVNVLSDMSSQLKRQLKVLLESPVLAEDKQSSRAAKLFFQSCMDEAAVTKQGLEPLRRFLNRFGDWPVLKGQEWDPAGFSWEATSGQLRRWAGVEAIVSLFVYVDMEDSQTRLLSLDQPILGLQSREYYLEGRDSEVMTAYRQYLIETAILFGAEESVAVKDLTDVVDFEIAIANISLSEMERKDHSTLYNPMYYYELAKKLPGIDWERFLAAAISDTGLLVDAKERLNIIGLPFLQRLPALLNRTSPRVLSNYLMWNLVSSYSSYVSKDFRGPYQKFRKVYSGVTQDTPRWTECVGMTRGFMAWPLSALYVDKHFNHEAKKEMEVLVGNLRSVMRENVAGVTWMDAETRNAALLKLSRMGQKIGYPDYIHNQTRVMEDYQGVEFSVDAYFENVIKVTASKIAVSMKKVRDRVDDSEWDATPSVVNAFYSFSRNEIVFPAGILQFPVFTVGAPRYVNYPRIGMVIGHEITHGYDDQGRQYNWEGNVRNWWNEQTLEQFTHKSQCFAKQYGDLEEPRTGLKLNGNLTLGENIADNGGLKIAKEAYDLWRAEKVDTGEPKLPGFSTYTDEQMFFLSFANGWCEIVREAAVKFYLTMDAHALAAFRVNVPLRNSPHFARAFQCAPGTHMNPTHKCQVW